MPATASPVKGEKSPLREIKLEPESPVIPPTPSPTMVERPASTRPPSPYVLMDVVGRETPEVEVNPFWSEAQPRDPLPSMAELIWERERSDLLDRE